MFSDGSSLVRCQLLLKQQKLLPRLPELFVELGPGLGHGGVAVAAGDDPGRRGTQVGVSIDHAGHQVVEVIRVPVEILQLASLDILIVWIVQTARLENPKMGPSGRF